MVVLLQCVLIFNSTMSHIEEKNKSLVAYHNVHEVYIYHENNDNDWKGYRSRLWDVEVQSIKFTYKLFKNWKRNITSWNSYVALYSYMYYQYVFLLIKYIFTILLTSPTNVFGSYLSKTNNDNDDEDYDDDDDMMMMTTTTTTTTMMMMIIFVCRHIWNHSAYNKVILLIVFQY